MSAAATGNPAPAVTWRPCPMCWGQRRIFELVPAPNGEGDLHLARRCPGCLGIGEVPEAVPAVAGRAA